MQIAMWSIAYGKRVKTPDSDTSITARTTVAASFCLPMTRLQLRSRLVLLRLCESPGIKRRSARDLLFRHMLHSRCEISHVFPTSGDMVLEAAAKRVSTIVSCGRCHGYCIRLIRSDQKEDPRRTSWCHFGSIHYASQQAQGTECLR